MEEDMKKKFKNRDEEPKPENGEDPEQTAENSAEEAAAAELAGRGLYIKRIGASGAWDTITAVRQQPEAGAAVQPGTVVEVEFSDLSARD